MSVNASDWASFSVAGATLILAGIAAWTAFEARRAVDAGINEASATQQLGEEARTDRELTWRPYLAVETRGMSTQGNRWQATVGVLNVGGGPAIDCIVFIERDHGLWAHSRVFSLASGARQELNLASTSASEIAPPQGLFSASAGAWRDPGLKRVVVGSDILGNRWRFPEGMDPERYRRGGLLPPEWSKWRP